MAFAHSSQCLFGPSEADALNKMTTVICLCHSGSQHRLRRRSKIQCWRRRPNVCRLALIPFFFFLFSRELPFPLSLRWQVYLKPAATPPLVLTALQVWRNKKLTSGTGRGEMDILLLDCPSVLFKLFQPPSRRLPLSLPPSLSARRRLCLRTGDITHSASSPRSEKKPGPPSRRRRPFKSLLMEQY